MAPGVVVDDGRTSSRDAVLLVVIVGCLLGLAAAGYVAMRQHRAH